jgi:hypothetical protein
MTPKDQARAAFVDMLMDKVRADQYPSATQLSMIEESLPPQLVPGYIELLLEKVREDQWPSVPMLQRIQRVTEQML